MNGEVYVEYEFEAAVPEAFIRILRNTIDPIWLTGVHMNGRMNIIVTVYSWGIDIVDYWLEDWSKFKREVK